MECLQNMNEICSLNCQKGPQDYWILWFSMRKLLSKVFFFSVWANKNMKIQIAAVTGWSRSRSYAFDFFLKTTPAFLTDFTNLHETNIRDAQTRENYLWITQSVPTCGIWTHKTWRSRKWCGDRLNHSPNRAVKCLN